MDDKIAFRIQINSSLLNEPWEYVSEVIHGICEGAYAEIMEHIRSKKTGTLMQRPVLDEDFS